MPHAPSTPYALDGSADIARAASELASRLPAPLAPLAAIAYDYMWSWIPRGGDVFRRLDPERWELVNGNPVRLLHELSHSDLEGAAADRGLVAAAEGLLAEIGRDHDRPGFDSRASPRHPIAFLCAEFAIHRSLPIYAGGLGVLAGDILKEASDLALPMVGVGLLYRQGYFLQRMDLSGYQHEYWMPVDPDRVPATLVTNQDGEALTVTVPVHDHQIVVQIWRVNVGRVPLYLLDADRPENSRIDRWITSRLYVGDRATRLSQYALLGIGSMRALAAMGMDPAIVHLNEGHAGLAPLELARRAMSEGAERHAALADARERTVFTTHTPVEAGNEGYDVNEITDVLGSYPKEIGFDIDQLLHLGRTHPDNPHEPFVMTPMGIKMSRAANAVSKRHGEVARQMWQPLFPERPVDAVPIGHVTNGVHIPTWMAPKMRALLDRYFREDWIHHAADPRTWHPVDDIPDAELWAVRNDLRRDFVEFARERTVANRLARSEPREFVEAAEHGFDPDVITFGFARRLATYKRLYLITMDQQRAIRLLENERHPLQLFLAGKAHPADEEGKRSPESLFSFSRELRALGRVSFLDNYDLEIARQLVSGCDVWINLPRPPLEASGTSGMKSALNGGLQLSILDGWWAEGFNGSNGWGLPGDILPDPVMQDNRDAAALYDCLEHEVLPLFYERDGDGVPTGWIARMKESLKTNGPRFSATRMVEEYVDHAYALRERSRS